MSNSNQSSKASNIFFAAGLLVVFGFLGLIFSNFATKESLEERAYRGDFDAATIETRWENLKTVNTEQAEKFDAEKVQQAMAAVVAEKAAPSPSEVVVPGSPTFMKQMEEASQESAAPEEAAPEKPAAETEDSPAPSEEKKPEGEKEAPAASQENAESKPATGEVPSGGE